MRSRPRLRKTAKWAGVVVCAVIAGAFAFTLIRPERSWVANCKLYVEGADGALILFEGGPIPLAITPPFRVRIDPRPFDLLWLPRWDQRAWGPNRSTWGPGAVVPLWIPFLLSAIPTALLWRRDRILARRARAGRCSTCGYELSGLAAGTACPECGETPLLKVAGGV